jgi:hypothetical protein
VDVYPYSSLTSMLDGLGVNATSRQLYPSNEPPYPLYKRLGGPPGQSGPFDNIGIISISLYMKYI